MDGDLAIKLVAAIKSALLGGCAALLGYLINVVHRGAQFRGSAFALAVAAGALIGHVVEGSWPHDWPGMGAVIAILGVSSFAVILGVQDGMPSLVKRFLEWLGGKLK